jgi:hypothetical protein
LLYIGEFIGVILIWIGYKYCQQPYEAPNFGEMDKVGDAG